MNSSTRYCVVFFVLLGVTLWLFLLIDYDGKISEVIKEEPFVDRVEQIAKNEENRVTGAVGKSKSDFIIRPGKRVETAIYPAYLIRNRTSSARLDTIKLYSANENVLTEASVVWADFILLEKEKLRSKQENIDTIVMNNLNVCSSDIVANLSSKLLGKDYDWCNWALRENGGKVKVGESFGVLNKTQQDYYIYLGCDSIVGGRRLSCDEQQGDAFIEKWKQSIVRNLCEMNAESKINCFDTGGTSSTTTTTSMGGGGGGGKKSRYCIFENVMMNFKRMRKKVGNKGRSWEQGFLSTSCGLEAKSDIGYFQLYKPDIEGSSDAICDYVFNETVLVYSHNNINSFTKMFSDYLNLWTVLWLSGASRYTHDVTLLNIDSLRYDSQYHDDEFNSYFAHYFNSFRRILKAKNFGKTSNVCFKTLIMQPNPDISYVKDGWRNDLFCSFKGPNSLYQRWNLNMRQDFGILTKESIVTNEFFTILLITKSKIYADDTNNNKNSGVTQGYNGFTNVHEINQMLNEITFSSGPIIVITQDFSIINFEEQILLLSSVSVVIGMFGNSITNSIVHLSVGTRFCCGIIEIFPTSTKYSKTYYNMRGNGNMARRMGHHYQRIDIQSSSPSSTLLSSPQFISSTTTRLLSSNINDHHRFLQSSNISIINKERKNRHNKTHYAKNNKSILALNATNQITHIEEKKKLRSISTNTLTYVPIDILRQVLIKLIVNIEEKPSCFLPSVLKKSLR